jgi:hypothetical protein
MAMLIRKENHQAFELETKFLTWYVSVMRGYRVRVVALICLWSLLDFQCGCFAPVTCAPAVSFSKTDDPDTRQVALTDLEALVRTLDDRTMPVFLKVFSDVHIERRKPAGKAAIMRFLCTATSVQVRYVGEHVIVFSCWCLLVCVWL